MDAVTMGGGMGLSQGASLRITTDRSRIAMPETKIGLTPDVGATHFLNRMPIEMALYIGLTGTTLSGPDAVACGLADVCVSHATLTNVDERPGAADLSAIDDRDGAQSSARSSTLTRALRHAFAPVELPSDEAPIARQRAWIVRHFHPDALPVDIVASLSHALENLHDSDETRGEREWLDATRTALTSYSPTMIHVTREALLRARAISLADSFRLEMGIVIRSIEEGDFREGVRAHLIDKDRTPAWQPDTLAAVAHARVEHFLSSPWPADRHPLAELGQDAPRE
jgi:enoyl-CoA hydratase/carnithine racemase